MGHKLTGVQLRTALRRLGDIQRQVGQEEYPHDPEKLLRALQAIGEGRIEIVEGGAVRVSPFPCQRLAAELIPSHNGKSWEVVEDVPSSFMEGCKLKFHSILEDGEFFLHIDKMRVRAKSKDASFGLVDVKFVLANQDLIPSQMQGGVLVFSGTLLRDPYGTLRVPCLSWSGSHWQLIFWQGNDFNRVCYLVSFK